MKKIEAIIRKTKFEDVKDALLEADIEWFSYYDVRGIGKARQGRIYRGARKECGENSASHHQGGAHRRDRRRTYFRHPH